MDRKRLGLVLVTIVLLIVLLITLPALFGNTFSAPKTPEGRIIYQSDQSGNMQLYLLDLAKMESVQLTNNTFVDYSPAYIPALNKIGFVSDRENGTNVYTMNLDGSGEQAVFPQSMVLDYPDWSPDGKLIVASYTDICDENSCIFDLYILDPIGLMKTQLSETVASEWVPQWSPDGQKIAFSSDRDGDGELYVINRDGSNLVQLTNNAGYDGHPRWSPDGSKIAFESDRDGGGGWDIFVMNADGSNPRPLTSTAASNDWMPFWSPDGKWLVYVSDQDGNNELYIIDINGQNQQRLTTNDFADQTPIWIP